MPSPFPGMNPYLEAIWHDFHDRDSREVITVVELLSPINKGPGEHRARYLSRRSAVRQSEAHLVEIDLLRGGRPMPAEGRRPGSPSEIVVPGLRERRPPLNPPRRDCPAFGVAPKAGRSPRGVTLLAPRRLPPEGGIQGGQASMLALDTAGTVP